MGWVAGWGQRTTCSVSRRHAAAFPAPQRPDGVWTAAIGFTGAISKFSYLRRCSLHSPACGRSAQGTHCSAATSTTASSSDGAAGGGGLQQRSQGTSAAAAAAALPAAAAAAHAGGGRCCRRAAAAAHSLLCSHQVRKVPGPGQRFHPGELVDWFSVPARSAGGPQLRNQRLWGRGRRGWAPPSPAV